MGLLQPPGLGAVQNQPTNLNFLATHRFRVILYRAPSIMYFVQECNLPGIASGNASQPTPFVDIPRPGDKINFEDFVMSFPVDEDMRNYKEIATWIIALGFPRQYAQYAQIEQANMITSSIGLMVLDANNKPQHSIVFYDAFPVNLSAINFDTKVNDTVIPICTATFKYTFFSFDEVNDQLPFDTQADRSI